MIGKVHRELGKDAPGSRIGLDLRRRKRREDEGRLYIVSATFHSSVLGMFGNHGIIKIMDVDP